MTEVMVKMPTSKKGRSNNRVKRVALLLDSNMAFDRAVAKGVGDYLRSKAGWIILMDPMMEDGIHSASPQPLPLAEAWFSVMK